MEPRMTLLTLGLLILVAKRGLGAAPGTRSPLSSPPAPEKAGRCPPGRGQDVPPSKRFCLSDALCPGSEKCCEMGKMKICVQPAMVGAGYCPKLCLAMEEPCLVSCLDDTWCGPGQKCCHNDCHVRCVAAEPAKPGVCPRRRVLPASVPCTNRCEDDRSCPGDQKCCFTGCGLECVGPLPEHPAACPTDPSGPATPLCSGGEQCDRGGCGQACAKPNLVKPGVCPLLLRGSLGPCTEVTSKNCSDDLDCEEAKKCCWTGCRYVCAVPEEVRPGTCPPRDAENGTSRCVTFCVRDADCPKPEKCCWLNCGRSCIAPGPGLPTIAPLQRKAKKKDPSEEIPVTRTTVGSGTGIGLPLSFCPCSKMSRCKPPAYGCPPGTVTYECKADRGCSLVSL